MSNKYKAKKKVTNKLELVKKPKTEVDFFNNIMVNINKMNTAVNQFFMKYRTYLGVMDKDVRKLLDIVIEREKKRNEP